MGMPRNTRELVVFNLGFRDAKAGNLMHPRYADADTVSGIIYRSGYREGRLATLERTA